MKRLGPQIKSFTTCASCPLNKKLYDQGTMFRSDVGDTVRRISVEVEQQAGEVNLFGDPPEFVDNIVDHYETTEVKNESWKCVRMRLLGHCATMQVVFPNKKYL